MFFPVQLLLSILTVWIIHSIWKGALCLHHFNAGFSVSLVTVTMGDLLGYSKQNVTTHSNISLLTTYTDHCLLSPDRRQLTRDQKATRPTHPTVKQEMELPIDPLLDVQSPLQVFAVVFDGEFPQPPLGRLFFFLLLRGLEQDPALRTGLCCHDWLWLLAALNQIAELPTLCGIPTSYCSKGLSLF